MIKKITIDQLVPGMFVHQILEQGALRVTSQGRVTSDDVVKTLRKRGVKTSPLIQIRRLTLSNLAISTVEKQNSPSDQPVKSKVSLENELVRAEKLHEQGKAIQSCYLPM